jgi:hypothetical protein
VFRIYWPLARSDSFDAQQTGPQSVVDAV